MVAVRKELTDILPDCQLTKYQKSTVMIKNIVIVSRYNDDLHLIMNSFFTIYSLHQILSIYTFFILQTLYKCNGSSCSRSFHKNKIIV